MEGINGEDYLMMDGEIDISGEGIENGNGNMVLGVKEEVVSSGSSFFGGEEDAVGEVVRYVISRAQKCPFSDLLFEI